MASDLALVLFSRTKSFIEGSPVAEQHQKKVKGFFKESEFNFLLTQSLVIICFEISCMILLFPFRIVA